MPRSPRTAAAIWLLFAFIVWNDVFDVYVRGGMYAYLGRQAQYEQGLGPRATIDELMKPAIRTGARVATLWATVVAGVGLAAVAWAVRRDRVRSAGATRSGQVASHR